MNPAQFPLKDPIAQAQDEAKKFGFHIPHKPAREIISNLGIMNLGTGPRSTERDQIIPAISRLAAVQQTIPAIKIHTIGKAAPQVPDAIDVAEEKIVGILKNERERKKEAIALLAASEKIARYRSLAFANPEEASTLLKEICATELHALFIQSLLAKSGAKELSTGEFIVQ